mgnify:CR=1 FL=1
MYAGQGEMLPHWQALTQELDQLGREGLERRHMEAQRLLRENGVTFNIYDGLRGMARGTTRPAGWSRRSLRRGRPARRS